EQTNKGDVPYGIRQVLPLVEIRIPFTLSQWELDNISRGAGDAELDAVVSAAAKAAKFEDSAIFNGFKPGNIQGLTQLTENKPITMGKGADSVPAAVGKARQVLYANGVEGPFSLVLNSDLHNSLFSSTASGYPPYKVVEDLLGGGQVLPSPVIKGGIVVSDRGGDFELTVGKDYAVGYSSHDSNGVEFFLTESFTFYVDDPAAAVVLKAGV
ncbi:MAG: family 1 encapsulin nanocompartment shell protein, partial [Planctomycetota bacterium]